MGSEEERKVRGGEEKEGEGPVPQIFWPRSPQLLAKRAVGCRSL